MTTPRYTLDELKLMKARLGAVLDLIETDPITVDGETGTYERKVNLRQKGAAVYFKWRPEIRLLPTTDTAPCTQFFTEIGLDPILTWQLLDHLEEMLTERAEATT